MYHLIEPAPAESARGVSVSGEDSLGQSASGEARRLRRTDSGFAEYRDKLYFRCCGWKVKMAITIVLCVITTLVSLAVIPFVVWYFLNERVLVGFGVAIAAVFNYTLITNLVDVLIIDIVHGLGWDKTVLDGQLDITMWNLHFSMLRLSLEVENLKVQHTGGDRGVDFEVDVLHLSVTNLCFHLRNLKVSNLHPKKSWGSRHMLAVKSVDFDIHARKFWCSCTNNVVVEEVGLTDVEVVVEFPYRFSPMSSSNVGKLVEFYSKTPGHDEDDEAKPASTWNLFGSSKKQVDEEGNALAEEKPLGEAPKKRAKKASNRKTQVNHVYFRNIGVYFYRSGSHILLNDVDYENFSQEFTQAEDATSQIVFEVLLSLLKSIVASVTSKAIANNLFALEPADEAPRTEEVTAAYSDTSAAGCC